nr:hypothetical protein CFP56_66417 [Quercus suber]
MNSQGSGQTDDQVKETKGVQDKKKKKAPSEAEDNEATSKAKPVEAKGNKADPKAKDAAISKPNRNDDPPTSKT